MFLILSERTDESAFWTYHRLLERGVAPIEWVTPEALAYARWIHRVGRGTSSVEVVLADGRRLRGDEVRGTLNRLLFVPRDQLALVQPSDREYVAQELSALYASWLYSLPDPVLNRGSGQCLSGRIRHISEWIWLASRCGLPVPEYRFAGDAPLEDFNLHATVPHLASPSRALVVLDGMVFGSPVPKEIAGGCQALARRSQLRILGVEFTVDERENWSLAGVSHCPDLRLGGEPLIDRLAAAFQGRSAVA
ncbi:MAG: hypothetical protein QNK03_27945 [Myxococcota bacterium]|nr:hypothetical protein [Myxococcota bacterium]